MRLQPKTEKKGRSYRYKISTVVIMKYWTLQNIHCSNDNESFPGL